MKGYFSTLIFYFFFREVAKAFKYFIIPKEVFLK